MHVIPQQYSYEQKSDLICDDKFSSQISPKSPFHSREPDR